MSDYISLAKTPSDWLLEQFDHLRGRRRGVGVSVARKMFEVKDDHPGECTATCMEQVDVATWPTPRARHALHESGVIE